MATLEVYQVTQSPTDVIAARSLEVGKQYSCQFLGQNLAELKFVEATSVPEVDADTNLVQMRRNIRIVPKAGEQVYVWSYQSGGILVINEVE